VEATSESVPADIKADAINNLLETWTIKGMFLWEP